MTAIVEVPREVLDHLLAGTVHAHGCAKCAAARGIVACGFKSPSGVTCSQPKGHSTTQHRGRSAGGLLVLWPNP